ncbi:MAG TPA: TonB family protein [Candidatus Solibacter sp.]|nr:TonB family protein [Candidatus Solibacter sp.]
MSSAEVWKTWEGRVIDGKYPLQQLLGGSDHSAVFRTELPGQPGQKAALKLIPADAGDADRQLARWQAASQLSHPNLIRIFECGRSGLTLLYAVMEYAEEDLSQILPQRALEPNEVADMLAPVLDTLSYLHSKGFVHGRVKPSNVQAVGDRLKLSSDHVVSTDDGNLTRRRVDVYDAPETAAGIVSPAGDLWSLGATLVASLTQNVPFSKEASADPGLPAAIPEPFRGIARECLHLDPKRRCSIAEIRARLQPAGRSVPAATAPPDVPATAAESSPRSSKRGPIVAAALFGAIIVAVLVFHFSHKSSVAPAPTSDQLGVSQPVPSGPPPATPPAAKTASQSAASSVDVIHKALPEVSKGARKTIRGTIKIGVKVEVDPSGKVTSAKLASPAESAYFNRLSLQAAQNWQFAAQEAPSAWLIRFRFRRTSTDASPERLNR